MNELTAAECWAFLRENTFGRIALSAAGQLDIFPINFLADGETILFRTAPGTKLLELTISGRVALEIDEADALPLHP
ncbi:MAG: pyridoxamine 5'-phosphate oxidase family protein [Lacisediminihabitans sp.]